MNDLVSIIMPSYNTAEYIDQAINSVINQTYTNWELIIVDDCSSDNTDITVRAFLDDCRIKFFKNDENRGAAYSRNFALCQAKGRWIAFLDSDDLWLPQKLEIQIKFMEENGYLFSYTYYSEITNEGKLKGVLITGPKIITKTGFYNYCWPGCLTVMYDAQAIGLIQINNIKKNNDYAMWLQICNKANCYLLEENLALYRRGRNNSISSQSIATLIKWHYRLFREAENQSALMAFNNTIRNMFFGVIKKLFYVKRVV